MAGRFENILETIGRTPVVKVAKLAPPEVELFVKLEAFNPLGSVKDRLALGVIEAAERNGELKPGQTVIEATSGNTGIGLAMVCAQKGYPLVVTMAENFSVERRKLMRFLGAKVVLTPASEKGSGMVNKALELAQTHGWFLCRQFENEANPDFHSKTTAVEILEDFKGDRLDYWVTGVGTGGTLKGVARVLKKERPETKIVVCEPDNSPLLGSGIPQARGAEGAPSESHPFFRPHLMQGWTPDFIPKLAEDAVRAELIDEILPIKGGDALRLSRELAQREGIFTGITGGATFAGALQICARAEKGAKVLCMLPDTGERYLSTPLFEDIPAEMTSEEIEISQSTPRYRFDVKSVPSTPGKSVAEAPLQLTRTQIDAANPHPRSARRRLIPVCLPNAFNMRARRLGRETDAAIPALAEGGRTDQGNRSAPGIQPQACSATSSAESGTTCSEFGKASLDVHLPWLDAPPMVVRPLQRRRSLAASQAARIPRFPQGCHRTGRPAGGVPNERMSKSFSASHQQGRSRG